MGEGLRDVSETVAMLQRRDGMTQKEYSAAIRALWARQLRDDEDIQGELSRVYSDGDKIALIFADGRWASYHWYAWPEGGGGIEIDKDPPAWEYLHAAGLLTDADRDEQQRLDRAYATAWQDARDRAEFERLKERYEAHSDFSE